MLKVRLLPASKDPNKPYNMHAVIKAILDDRNFFEIMPDWASNIIVGFGAKDVDT